MCIHYSNITWARLHKSLAAWIFCSIVYSEYQQQEFHWSLMDSLHKWPVVPKRILYHYVLFPVLLAKRIMIIHKKKKSINYLTHWCWVMHICVSKWTIIGSNNGLSPGRRQAIIWTNAGILTIGPLWKQSSVQFKSEFEHCRSRKCIWKCRLRNHVHFVSTSMC